MCKMSEMDVMVNDALHMIADGFTDVDAINTVATLNNTTEAESEYLAEAVIDAVAAGREATMDDDGSVAAGIWAMYDEEYYDGILERQEMEDFAQDGYFENMDAWEIY
jgi:hypothetical protein